MGMITIAATSRFHYEKLALQLERFNFLDCWLTSLPKSKTPSFEKRKVINFPLPLYLHLGASKYLPSLLNAGSFIEDQANHVFDMYARSVVRKSSSAALIGLSHNICLAGLKAKEDNKLFVCDVPIAHPEYLNQVLGEEYKKLKIPFKSISSYQVDREKIAHQESNIITVASNFVKKTLVEKSIDKDKIQVIPYGCACVSKFSSAKEARANPAFNEAFNILFVGQVTPRKGIHYLLQAFNQFKHPNKHLTIAGPLASVSKDILNSFDLDNVTVTGVCSKNQLHHLYSTSHVFVLPSLAEGLALVIGEALSYGLPVIFTENTGADSLVVNNIEGIKVKSHSSSVIVSALEVLASDRPLLELMSMNALHKSRSSGSWDLYGDGIFSLLSKHL